MMTRAWHQCFKKSRKEDRTCDNIIFDSLKEMRAYQNLKTLQSVGQIKNLKVHVRHDLLLPNGVPIKTPKGRTAYYESDFEYTDCVTGSDIIADCKGYCDKYSRFKIAVFEAISGRKVLIIK